MVVTTLHNTKLPLLFFFFKMKAINFAAIATAKVMQGAVCEGGEVVWGEVRGCRAQTGGGLSPGPQLGSACSNKSDTASLHASVFASECSNEPRKWKSCSSCHNPAALPTSFLSHPQCSQTHVELKATKPAIP